MLKTTVAAQLKFQRRKLAIERLREFAIQNCIKEKGGVKCPSWTKENLKETEKKLRWFKFNSAALSFNLQHQYEFITHIFEIFLNTYFNFDTKLFLNTF